MKKFILFLYDFVTRHKTLLEVNDELKNLITQLLKALEDGKITQEEIVELKKAAYEALLKYNFDKK